MATSVNPAFTGYSPRNQVCLHSALKVAQAASMLVPPAYVGLCLARKRPMSVRGFIRRIEAFTIGGAGVGYGAAYLRLMNEPEVAIEDRVFRLKHNRSQVQADDYSFIGSVVGLLLTPAVFLNRAPIFALGAGGICLGLGAGVWAHIIKSFTEGKDIKPEGMASELELPKK